MSMRGRDTNSMATILTFENRDAQSEWSTIWSTSNIPGMDNASGGNSRYRTVGRRRLRIGSLVLGTLLTMHCRVATAALTGGFFIFIMFLVIAVVALANPLRHFEVYLGQWSINGPGRAFRIVPLLDGIGIAMCLNAIFRAIIYCAIAAMAATYVLHAVKDDKLPFTYCRDVDLIPYDPILKDINKESPRKDFQTKISKKSDKFLNDTHEQSTVGFVDRAWRMAPSLKSTNNNTGTKSISAKMEICNDSYPAAYPTLSSTPAYNFFYVEVVELSPDYKMRQFNTSMGIILLIIWITIWLCMVVERLRHGRLVWNNTPLWIIYVPWVWTAVLGVNASLQILTNNDNVPNVFRIDAKEVMAAITDAFEVALYTHATSIGTELITGKGLNRYASGHIDPLLNGENVWHSSAVLLLTTLHAFSAALCAVVDTQLNQRSATDEIHESTLWILPMYSKCTAAGHYSHFVSTIVFFGLVFSYITVAYLFLKTALHTIFEYRVKLVFIEQWIVGGLLASCAALSMIFATSGGLPLLESIECLLSGVATHLICLLELVAMLYVYRSRDFTSDVNVSMEESMCPPRINYQWQCLPFLAIVTLCMKTAVLFQVELPQTYVLLGLIPLACVVLAIPLRAIHNTYTFLRPGN